MSSHQAAQAGFSLYLPHSSHDSHHETISLSGLGESAGNGLSLLIFSFVVRIKLPNPPSPRPDTDDCGLLESGKLHAYTCVCRVA